VTDKTGGIVIGATVTVTKGAGASQTTVTDDHGEYRVTGLSSGTYKVTIGAAGFKDFTAASVAVSSGQSIRLDATLEPKIVVTTVKVEGDAVAIETESAQMTGTITSSELDNIGLNGRNFTQLIALAPGVSNQTGQDEGKVGVRGSVNYSVNGGRVEYNTFEVDGSDVMNPAVHGSQSVLIVTPSLDAINDVQVLTSNYGAQYGKSASGTIEATTKSGGNEFHGDGYYYFRNQALDARNYFDPPGPKPLLHKNDLGLTVGGPVYIPGHYNTKKDKTFFFFSEEYRAEREPQDFSQGVPSVAERQGNFSDVCPYQPPGQNAVEFLPSQYPDCPPYNYDGNTGKLVPYPNNTIPANQISPISKALLSAGIIPLPNSVGGCDSSINSCYDVALSLPTYWRQELFRLDHHFTSKLVGTFRYIHDDWDTIVATPQWGFTKDNVPTVANRFYGPGLSMVGRLTHTLSNTLVNDLSFSYTSAFISLSDINGPGATFERSAAEPAISNMGYIFDESATDFGGKLPGIVLGGTNAAYGGAGLAVDPGYMPWNFLLRTYGAREELAKVAGKHYFQFGVQYLFDRKKEVNPPTGADTGDIQGLLYFNNESRSMTGESTGQGTIGTNLGNVFANFLMGNVIAYTQDSSQKTYDNLYQAVEPYAQDTWHVTRRLTLDLGARISLFDPYHEQNLNAYNWDPQAWNPALAATMHVDQKTGILMNCPAGPCHPVPLNLSNLDPRLTNGLVRCGTNGVPDSCQTTPLFNPAPRIGLAWDPTGKGKTSIRAGYGIFFDHGTANEVNTGSLEGSAPMTLNMTQTYFMYGLLGFTGLDTYSCIGGVGAGCNAVPQGAYPLNVTSIQRNPGWPYAQQWSLSIQRELSPNVLATIAYVGSKGTHLPTELEINQIRPVSASDNPFSLSAGAPLTSQDCIGGGGGNPFRLYLPDPNGPPTVVLVEQGQGQWQSSYVNLEAACYSMFGLGVQPNALRPYPGMGEIYFLGDLADSTYNALQVTVRRTKGRFMFGAAYTYGHSLDDSSDRSDTTFVNAYDLRGNKANSSFDQRHNLTVNYVYQLDLHKLGHIFAIFNGPIDDPPNEMKRGLANAGPAPSTGGGGSRWDHFLNGWELSGVTTFQSGTPFTIINGGSSTGVAALDNAGVANGVGAGSYPDIVGNPHAYPLLGAYGAYNIPGTIGPLLGNPGAFVAPQGLTFGNVGRNSFTNPSVLNFNIAVLKNFHLRESIPAQFRWEVFNLFNATQFRIYDPNLGNTSHNTVTCYGGPYDSALGGLSADGISTDCLTGNAFLHPIDAHQPRIMQLSIKLFF